MTFALKLRGSLSFPDEKSATQAYESVTAAATPLRETTRSGERLDFRFDGTVDDDVVAEVERGLDAVLAVANQGSVVVSIDGDERTKTALQRTFWQKRWDDGQIGFHEGRPNDLLVRHFDALGASPGDRVFVPLCGKAVDLDWLAERGLDVVGVELSMTAIEAYFSERGKRAQDHAHPVGRHAAFTLGRVTIVCDDLFEIDPAALCAAKPFDVVYDRAALVALEISTRGRYVERCRSLLGSKGRTLLVAFSYEPAVPVGPPWSIDETAVRACFDREVVDVLEQRETSISPRMEAAGVKRILESVYRLRR